MISKVRLFTLIIKSNLYAIQLNEPISINNQAIVLIFFRYIDTGLYDIQEEFLCYLNLIAFSTSQKKFNIILFHFQKIDLTFSKCICICTDCAVIMMGKFNGLVTCIQCVDHIDI